MPDHEPPEHRGPSGHDGVEARHAIGTAAALKPSYLAMMYGCPVAQRANTWAVVTGMLPDTSK